MYLTNRKKFKSDKTVLQQWTKRSSYALSENKPLQRLNEHDVGTMIFLFPLRPSNPTSGHAPQTN